MLKNQWAIEEEKEKNDAHQQFLLNRERNLELIGHNATEKQLREHAELQEKNRDKVLLEQALTRERNVEQFEADERLARRREIQELQKHYHTVHGEKAAFEKHVDELTQ